jgi:hypothetical protein
VTAALIRPLVVALAVAASACSSPLRPGDRAVVRDGDIVAGTGTIRYFTIEGGFYAIRGDDDVTYDPIDLPLEVRQDGLRIRFRARLRPDMASIHQVGPVVEVLEIAAGR